MMRARHALLLAFALTVSVTLGGCDLFSSDDDDRAPDAELIVGTWTGTGVSARVTAAGGVSIPLTGIDASALGASFQTSAVTLDFDPADDAELNIPRTDFSIPLPNEASLSGTYRIDDSAGSLTLTQPDIAQDLVLGYRLRSETDLEIIAEDAAAFARLFDIVGGNAEALSGVISGGSIRYTK